MTTYTTVNGPHTVTGTGADDVLHHTNTEDSGVDLSLEGGNLVSGYSGFLDGLGSSNVEFSGITRFFFTDTGDGIDHIHVGDGDDTLNGGANDDVLDGAGGNDVISGGSGNDIWGGDKSGATTAIVIDLNHANQAYLSGGLVNGCEGFDLTTGSGDDRLTGTTAQLADFIDAGAGNDRIELPMAMTDTVHGGIGIDTLVLTTTVPDGVDMAVSGSFATGYSGFFDGANPANVSFTGIEHFSFTDNGDGIDNITTGDGRDTLKGGANNDVLNSGGGSDIVDGGEGDDVWAGDKSFTAVAMTIDLTQAAAQTYFSGGSVDNVEALRLKTGSGNDKLVGTAAQLIDSLDTGAGNDRIVLPMAQADNVNGGSGRDVLVVSHAFINGVDMSVTGDLANGYSGMFDGLGANNLTFAGIEDFAFTDTGGGADFITTGDGKDSLNGGGGDDILNTAGGVDVVDGGAGDDMWIADKSFTTFAMKINLTKPGAQEYFGGGSVTDFEGMRLKTGSGDDKLTGTTANLFDLMDTGAGDDVITLAQFGSDTANGGAGEDTLVLVNSQDSGVDMAVGIDPLGGFAGVFDGLGGNNTQFSSIENFNFTDDGLGDDHITTGDGKDTLNAGDGADQLNAGGGRDILRGGGGSDTLTGGGGKDLLTGGGQGDRFVYSVVTDSTVGAQRDVIDDFGNGDRIDLSGIDANSVAGGDQAFTFIGTQGFHSVAGELRAVLNSGVTLISGDVDGDGLADFQIELGNGATVDPLDFVP